MANGNSNATEAVDHSGTMSCNLISEASNPCFLASLPIPIQHTSVVPTKIMQLMSSDNQARRVPIAGVVD